MRVAAASIAAMSLPITLIVLIIVFRGLIAAALPVAAALDWATASSIRRKILLVDPAEQVLLRAM